jgi:hypothetical protein
VEHILHEFASGLLGVLPRVRQKWTDLGLANSLAQDAFRQVPHGCLWVLHVEKISHRLQNAPKDDEADINDVLITGQHGARFSYIAIAEGTDPHPNNVLPCNFRQIHHIDWIRQTEVQTGRLLAYWLAETQDRLIRTPSIEDSSRLGQRTKQRLLQALVAQSANDAVHTNRTPIGVTFPCNIELGRRQ